MSFEERLYQLLDAQDIFLKNKRITMNHRLSKIKDKQASIDAIDYKPDRKIDKAQIQSLAQLNFIRSNQNVIITGKTGTGVAGGTNFGSFMNGQALVLGFFHYRLCQFPLCR